MATKKRSPDKHVTGELLTTDDMTAEQQNEWPEIMMNPQRWAAEKRQVGAASGGAAKGKKYEKLNAALVEFMKQSPFLWDTVQILGAVREERSLWTDRDPPKTDKALLPFIAQARKGKKRPA